MLYGQCNDSPVFVSGTLKALAIEVANSEWPKWETVMATDPDDAELLASQARNAPLTRPRPGHSDLVGMQKYGFDESRPILERASARETAARVALDAPRSWLLGNAAINRLLYTPQGYTLVGWSDTFHLEDDTLDEAAA